LLSRIDLLLPAIHSLSISHHHFRPPEPSLHLSRDAPLPHQRTKPVLQKAIKQKNHSSRLTPSPSLQYLSTSNNYNREWLWRYPLSADPCGSTPANRGFHHPWLALPAIALRRPPSILTLQAVVLPSLLKTCKPLHHIHLDPTSHANYHRTSRIDLAEGFSDPDSSLPEMNAY